MQNTVIGVYDQYTRAQAAVDALMTQGIERSKINISPEQETDDARTSALSDRDEGWSIGNFFRKMFGSDDASGHSDIYHEAVRRGSYVVTVEADSDEQRDQVCETMDRFDPIDLDERSASWRSEGWSGYERGAAAGSDDRIDRGLGASSSASASALGAAAGSAPSGRTATDTTGMQSGGTLEGEARLPIVEEQMRVGKRMVQRGGVRIYQHITDQPVEENIRLREEQVHVERQPVDKPASEADLAAFQEGSMELRESAEEPVVSKSARVVEEVVVGKDVTERDEKITDNLRRTDVEIEPLSATDRDTSDTGFDRDYYRNHWQSSYASEGGRYEDFEPAYRFGSDLRRNDSYSGRNWNDIEPEVRRDWEARNAGSPWERTKDAVRHAWERTTGH